tara:strand:- start:496 stop:1074 length:579 start_codon:yes stop_codon:yes gene_type:complete
MIKNLMPLLITILLFGCKQNEGKLNSSDTETSIEKSITLNDSISSNKKYNKDEIIQIDKLMYQKTDSTLITGELLLFYETGEIQQLQTFKDGILNGPRKGWHINGQLRQEGAFEDGKIIGFRRVWYDTGKLRDEGYYKNGKLEGIRKGWWENGQLKHEYTYNQNKFDGPYRKYTKEGELVEEKIYKDGRVIN